MEQQWHINQNNIAVSFLKVKIYSLRDVISLLCEKVCLSVCFFFHCFQIFEIVLA